MGFVLFYRDVAVKFNDYFEFPREFDMEPYTVQGLARIESKHHLVFNICMSSEQSTCKCVH